MNNSINSDKIVYEPRRWPLYLIVIIAVVILFLQAPYLPKMLTGQIPIVFNLAFGLDLLVTVIYTAGFLFMLWAIFFGLTRVIIEQGACVIQYPGRLYRYQLTTLTDIRVKETTQRYKGRTTIVYWIRFRAPDQRKFALGVEGEEGKQVYEKFKTLTTQV